MKKVCICGFAACLALFMSQGIHAQDFELSIAGPDSFSGDPGSEHAGDFIVNLTQSADATGPGAEGWSLGVAITGGVPTSVTTDGTTAAPEPEGLEDGFNKTDIIDPANNNGTMGVTSAVVLSFGAGIVLPPNTTSSILAIGATFTIGDADSTATLAFQAGLVGMGQPVDLVVTESGSSADFTTVDKEVALLAVVAPPSCCDAAYNVGFSAEAINSETPNDGLADASDVCSASGATVDASGETAIYTNIVSNGEGGVEGWSMSIEVDGDIDITAITTDGTIAAGEPEGLEDGFNKTFLADPELSGGRRGATTAVVLSFGAGITLPFPGTASVNCMTVDKLDPEAETASGRIFFPADGLTSAGQPVDNVVTVGGSSAEVCNFATADITVNIAGAAGGVGSFLRGDCNTDGIVDIADPVWLLNELFREGPGSSCGAACDANADNALDLADTTYSIAYMFEGGAAPSAPFPDCGTVEDTGDLTCEASACE